MREAPAHVQDHMAWQTPPAWGKLLNGIPIFQTAYAKAGKTQRSSPPPSHCTAAAVVAHGICVYGRTSRSALRRATRLCVGGARNGGNVPLSHHHGRGVALPRSVSAGKCRRLL